MFLSGACISKEPAILFPRDVDAICCITSRDVPVPVILLRLGYQLAIRVPVLFLFNFVIVSHTFGFNEHLGTGDTFS